MLEKPRASTRAIVTLLLLVCIEAIVSAEVIDWRYPKKDLVNSSAIVCTFSSMLTRPWIKWVIRAPLTLEDMFDGWWGQYAAIADLDGDGELELLVAQGRGFGARPQRVVCLSISNGASKWEFALESSERSQWASYNVVDVDDDPALEVVFGTGARIAIVDGATGALESEFPLDGPMCLGVTSLAPGEEPDIIVNGYADPKNCYRLDGETGDVIWSYPTYGSAYNVPAIVDLDGDGNKEILFHVHRYNPSRETEFCLSSSGEELWRFNAAPSPEQEAQAPPELGWVPDFGYVSTIVGDFLGNGEQQVFFATRCHAYLLSNTGDLLWRYPLVEGWGIFLIRRTGGEIEPDTHGTGGREDHAAAGDLNGDGALDVVMGLDAEYRAIYDEATGETTYERVRKNNRVIALDGKTGELLWDFEGAYPTEPGLERMRQPILMDLTGDGLLDVVVVSTDGNMYGLRGLDGTMLWKYEFQGRDLQLMAASVVDEEPVLFVIENSPDEEKSRLNALSLAGTEAVFRVERETGDVLSDGAYFGTEFVSGSADVAEWVPVSEPVEPGDVLEIDPENPGHYRKARGPCSQFVAGVVSTQPGVILGHTSDTEGKTLLALAGIVPVKVTDEGGPIRPGDLLVASSTPGFAMRWEPDSGKPCHLVGKALDPWEEGSGLIRVLLMH